MTPQKASEFSLAECYDKNATEALRPNCVPQNISYIDHNTGETKFIVEYPLECRIYRNCTCQDLVFRDTNTSSTVVLPIGDIYYFTGLRLNCSALEDDDPEYVLTDVVTVTDPETNITTTQSQGDIFVYVQSNAGLNGMGESFPATDPFPVGFSLYPNVYNRGVIDKDAVNCTCDDTGNRTSANFGLECEYSVTGNDTFCMEGVVRTCEHLFLECYPVDDQVRIFMEESGGVITDATLLSTFCLGNGTITNDSSGVACDAALTIDFQVAPWQLYLVGSFACIADLEEGTILETVFSGLNATSAAALCPVLPDLIAEGCPTIPTSGLLGNFSLACDSCEDAFGVTSEILLVRACSPYQCPISWNITCPYAYAYPLQTYTWINSEVITYGDGRTFPGSGNVWDNGEALCPTVNSHDSQAKTAICFQEILKGRPCNGSIEGVITAPNATIVSGGEFPYNLTADCGAPYTCVAPNSTTCSCDIQQIAVCFAPYLVGNNSALFHIDNVKDELTLVDISFNRAQQLPFAMKVDRTSDAIIFNNSIFATEFTDYRGALREIHKQNYQLDGQTHDMVSGLPQLDFNIQPYRVFCDEECPQEYTDESEFDCIVDASIPEDQQDNFYQQIQDAIDDGCKVIGLRNYENFYTEDITFDNDFEALISLDGACILGSQHQLKQDNVLFRGVCFLHPGDEAKPLFVPTQDMDRLHIKNCILDGGGVRGAGILPLNLKKVIKELIINDTEVSLWNYAAFIVKKVDSFQITHNTFKDCFGRLVDIRYENVMRIHSNVLLNCRGTGDSKGVPLLRGIARTMGDYGKQQDDQDRSCSRKRGEKYGLQCAMYNNVQQTDTTEEDFRDVCYSLLGGAMSIEQIFDNVCVKAGVGFQLRQLDGITSISIPSLLRFNSQIRPSNFRTTASAKNVNDWQYDEFFNDKDDVPFLFTPFATRKCNYPCSLPEASFPVCTVNPNFLVGYPGIRGEIYSVYGQLTVSAFGFGVFTNFSHALQFCDIIRVNPYTNGTERPIYCVGNKGGRMFRDNWSVMKEGVSFYGALLPNESNICPECFHRCDVFGDGWFVLAENWTTVNVSYTRDNRSMDENVNMISTLPSTTPVWYAVRFSEVSESSP